MRQGEKVYVVESGVYAERFISGVYASAEAAMEANPVSTVDAARERELGGKPGWHQVAERQWDNGLDMGSAVSVYEYEVKT